MSLFSQVLKIIALGRVISFTAPSLNKLLTGLATIAVLVIIASVLTGGALLGALYFIYHMLLMRGMERETALIIMSVTTILIITFLLGWAWTCWSNIGEHSRRLMKGHQPFGQRIGNITNAFVSGLLGEDLDEEF